MSVGSVVYFLVTTSLLGFIVDLFVKKWDADLLEKVVMRLGVGIGIFPLLGSLLNLLHIPLDWRVFLGLGFLVTALALWKNQTIGKFGKITKKKVLKEITGRSLWYTIIVVVLFFVTVQMYTTGSFAYTWFENGDPWSFAAASKYIAEEKTFSAPHKFAHFAESYPQGFPILMGVLHQTNDSINWTMKFFTSLLLSFGVLFTFYFARRFSKSDDFAIFAAAFVFAVPAWLSHFIFALSFNMVLSVVFLYVVMQMGPKNKWKYLAIFLLGSIWATHYYTAVVTSLFFVLYYLTKTLIEQDLNKDLLQVGVFGFLSSLVFYIPSFIRQSYTITPETTENFGGIEWMFDYIVQIPTLKGIIIILIIAAILYSLYKYDGWFKKLKKPMKKHAHVIYLAAIVLFVVILLLPVNIYEKKDQEPEITLSKISLLRPQYQI